jgi:hypothetical protein
MQKIRAQVGVAEFSRLSLLLPLVAGEFGGASSRGFIS